MNFDLSEAQQLSRDAVERFLGPVDIAQRRRDREAASGDARDRWTRLAELGLLALAAPEDMGGLGGSRIDLALVAEALGHGLAVDPWLENGAFPIRLAVAGGDRELVHGLVAGTTRAAVAFAEPGRRYSLEPGLRANGECLTGAKTFVLGARDADILLVTASDGGSTALFAVSSTAAGIARRDYALVDGSVASELKFYQTPARRLDLPAGGFLQVVGDIRLLAAAELVGLAQRLFDDTVAYVKQREQFGVAIGSFQALQHRLVDCYAGLELARSLVLRTALEDAADWPAAAAATKAYAGAAAMHIGREAVQLHGGMGLSDDLAVGHAFKRVMLLDKLLGDDETLLDVARAA